MATTTANKAAATRFVEAFNTDNWDLVHEVVDADFVLHHPAGGTMQLGPQGMVAVWRHFKAAIPNAWHPIPVMIAEGDYLANLLPTYGTFDGDPHQGIPATGQWLEYGMVNIVRFAAGKLVEAWFGMDPLIEMRQMGAIPSPPARQLTQAEQANIGVFFTTVDGDGMDYDNVVAFGDVVIAMGPSQFRPDAKTRWVEMYRVVDSTLTQLYTHEFSTDPPYGGGQLADSGRSRAVVETFFREVLRNHNLAALPDLAFEHILVHPTGMPCEAGFYGLLGVEGWLWEQWHAFPNLSVTENLSVAVGDVVAVHWTAQGVSRAHFMGLPPTGERMSFWGVSMFRIEDEKIAEIWETRDTLGVLRQLEADPKG